jgi:LVIVD repeat
MINKNSMMMTASKYFFRLLCILLCTTLIPTNIYASSDQHVLVERNYPVFPDAPSSQSPKEVKVKNKGCMSCHTKTDQLSMHASDSVNLACIDCHGGNTKILKPASSKKNDQNYRAAQDKAHVLPLYPEDWHYPSSANPKQSYTLLNRESSEYIRFVNPSDYRVARKSCGACHLDLIQAAERSLMSTSAMLWGGAAYNNGILPYKNYLLGESYTRDGTTAAIKNPSVPDDKMKARGVLPILYPLPAWEVIPPADVFRVFERGGRNITNLFAETGIPNQLGQIQRLEEPGRVDIKQSNRGPATGGRIAVPVLNLTKTRLNDPHMWFMGTNDNPGDFRHSGCSGCHTVYANDRDPRHSGPYAKFGHTGKTQTIDPTISHKEEGHPITHSFSRAIPTSQCMSCHMHQPNMFVNTYLGYTMWDYESDAPFMWPEKQKYPTAKELHDAYEKNPEGASARGKWIDQDFLRNVSKLNPKLKDTQFADYHGHGWNFRAVYKRDRKGNLLDKAGKKVADADPKKFQKAVHMASIHLDKGMHCVDCHFAQDNHGTGNIHGEVAAAVEIKCKDCHGTADKYPNLRSTGPAAPPEGTDLSLLRNPDGKKRFEWIKGKLIQRSLLNKGMEWEMSLVKDSVNSRHKNYNAKSARAKLMSKNTTTLDWGAKVPAHERAHDENDMHCYSCHTSWTTSCGGCHLPIEANNKTERHHFEGGTSRNYATYNPQVARDQMFQLGKRGPIKGGRIAPVRSSSALVLSSTNSNRERIYIQQPPVAASGFSSQAFAPHFPHTARKEETKTCTDCHLSKDKDNNAIMSQLLLLGTNFVNFVGLNAWVGTDNSIEGVRVTEWEEPQAVIGSYLHKYAYPDWYKNHQQNNQVLKEAYSHDSGPVRCLQLRGEYLYAAEGEKGMQVYDVASIANKGISQRIITAPFSPLGHNTHIESENATCVALPTNQPIHPDRNKGEQMRKDNQEQAFHPIYDYAFITDTKEGLILTDVNTLSDGEPRNNFLKRAMTWNKKGILNGARHITIAGYYAYIAADAGIVVVNLNNPLKPELASVIPIKNSRSTALQFRYLFVIDTSGLRVVDVTQPEKPKIIKNSLIKLNNAYRVYLARTYAYVAAGNQGLAIIDIEKTEQPKLIELYNANGKLNDARDIVIGTTNASLIAYVADGHNGLKVLQLTSPDSQPKFYGFSPKPVPQLIASYPTKKPALSLSKGLDRDRAVDETGNQIAVFGRLGSRPFTLEEMQKLYLNKKGAPWFVDDSVKKKRKK